ncbi:HD domain-containing protein [Pontibacterium granulatum]|uniref:HD-GYP domain-containing protein n=1 Tax=Pontibacterium granulatum TaxID=2036029 RepID=UPI00249C953D|nr:HD domain-containing phosphohydrolase [Pontibacterium granulatum]MDI3323270.1 HD domain-containing protein [Pontibacterium granulatum]
MQSITKRTTLHYLTAMLLFALYGVQVCPFLDSLTTTQLLAPILIAFCVQWALRMKLEAGLEQRTYKQQVKHQFKIDLGLFLIFGAGLGLYNWLNYGFPMESAGKVIVGMSVLGFLIACELALYREYLLAQKLTASNEQLQPDDNPYPLTQKFIWFAAICAIALIGVVFLVINKDLEWLIHTGNSIPLETSQRYILGEIIFVVGAMMIYILAIIVGYSRNLKLFIGAENATLARVSNGELNVQVPVTSNDEFGLMAVRTNQMIKALAARTKELSITRDASILGLASLAETRDNETGAHILRTQNYVRVLAEELAKQDKYHDQLDPETIDLLYKSAPLHDVGKVGIPDNILLKPGKLTDAEFEIMKGHPQIGADALAVAKAQLGSNSFLQTAREISLTHHEKWDGRGYPKGLKGEEIPISGRLMALADVYDALTTKRVYKPAFPHEKARAIIVEGRGSHFDPAVVDAFLALEQTFIDIATTYVDKQPTAA